MPFERKALRGYLEITLQRLITYNNTNGGESSYPKYIFSFVSKKKQLP